MVEVKWVDEYIKIFLEIYMLLFWNTIYATQYHDNYTDILVEKVDYWTFQMYTNVMYVMGYVPFNIYIHDADKDKY